MFNQLNIENKQYVFRTLKQNEIRTGSPASRKLVFQRPSNGSLTDSWDSSGNPLGIPQESTRNPLGIPQESRRNPLGIPLESRGYPLRIPQESLRNSSGIPQESRRNPLGIRQESLGDPLENQFSTRQTPGPDLFCF